MLNQIILVGRLTENVEMETLENGRKVANIILAVNRSYKNAEGMYETDFIKCTLWNGIAENTAEYCRKGDLLGIKGRLETETFENENGEKQYKLIVIAERVTFLSSNKKSEEK